MVRNELIEALKLVREGCKQTLLSYFFLCSTQNFYVQERNPLCTFIFFSFLETVDLGATILFKKYPEIKIWKAQTAVLSFVITQVFKGWFYFQQFLKYIYYTTMMYFFKKANVSVDTGLFQWALFGKYHSLDTRGQYVCFLATVVLQEGIWSLKLGGTIILKSTCRMYLNWWGKKKYKLPVLAYWDLMSKWYMM